MTMIPADAVREDDWLDDPILWQFALADPPGMPIDADSIWAPGTSRRVKTWIDRKHPQRPHLLALRGGVPLHTDRGAIRYSVQVVLRNDGWRQAGWSPDVDYALDAGTCHHLDTWSPHALVDGERGGLYVAAVMDFPSPVARAAADRIVGRIVEHVKELAS